MISKKTDVNEPPILFACTHVFGVSFHAYRGLVHLHHIWWCNRSLCSPAILCCPARGLRQPCYLRQCRMPSVFAAVSGLATSWRSRTDLLNAFPCKSPVSRSNCRLDTAMRAWGMSGRSISTVSFRPPLPRKRFTRKLQRDLCRKYCAATTGV